MEDVLTETATLMMSNTVIGNGGGPKMSNSPTRNGSCDNRLINRGIDDTLLSAKSGAAKVLSRSMRDSTSTTKSLSRSNSPSSCASFENNERELLNGHNSPTNGTADDSQMLSSLGSNANSQNGTTISTNGSATLTKKRVSSGRQLTKKAKRVRFFRNGDKFYPGIVIPVSNERYRSFESLTEDLTRLLGEIIKVRSGLRGKRTFEQKFVAIFRLKVLTVKIV